MSRQPDSNAGRVFIGYARVSTRGQDLDAQRAALGAAGCVRIFEEKASGAKRDRPELARMLDHLRAGDVVTITRLDRLARSTGDLLAIAERIKEAGAGLRSLAEPWADTSSPAGKMILTVMAGIAEFERSLIIDRTRGGREAAKARGVKFGPRPTLSKAQIDHGRRTGLPAGKHPPDRDRPRALAVDAPPLRGLNFRVTRSVGPFTIPDRTWRTEPRSSSLCLPARASLPFR